MTRPRALVIGGSVGGLFAAHLLRNAGWDAAVYERTTGSLGDRGTGIGTRPELFAVMRRIGIEAGARIDVRGRTALGPAGDTVHEMATPAVTSGWVHVWRPLRSAMPDGSYHAGKALVGLEQNSAGVTALFSDDSRATGDLLIAADGLHSTARRAFLPDVAPRYAGYVAWRGAVDAGRLPASLHGLMFHRMAFGFPDGEMMLSIPMPAPEGSQSARACHFVWFRPADRGTLADLCTDATGRRHDLSIPPPLIRPELIARLKRSAAERLAPQFSALIEAAPQILLQPIFDLESPCIAFGRVALLGDAAFVARPHVATGVMKAALDAEALTDALTSSNDDVEKALTRYNAIRQPYGAWLVARGRHIGAVIAGSDTDPRRRIETVMNEYGSAGLVRGEPIAARLP